jgi:hypothetical protein
MFTTECFLRALHTFPVSCVLCIRLPSLASIDLPSNLATVRFDGKDIERLCAPSHLPGQALRSKYWGLYSRVGWPSYEKWRLGLRLVPTMAMPVNVVTPTSTDNSSLLAAGLNSADAYCRCGLHLSHNDACWLRGAGRPSADDCLCIPPALWLQI